MEGVYRGFASTLGFEDAPARALSIALFMRVAQFALATCALGVATVIPKRSPSPAPAPAPEALR
jgi:hypothetical protein